MIFFSLFIQKMRQHQSLTGWSGCFALPATLPNQSRPTEVSTAPGQPVAPHASPLTNSHHWPPSVGSNNLTFRLQTRVPTRWAIVATNLGQYPGLMTKYQPHVPAGAVSRRHRPERYQNFICHHQQTFTTWGKRRAESQSPAPVTFLKWIHCSCSWLQLCSLAVHRCSISTASQSLSQCWHRSSTLPPGGAHACIRHLHLQGTQWKTTVHPTGVFAIGKLIITGLIPLEHHSPCSHYDSVPLCFHGSFQFPNSLTSASSTHTFKTFHTPVPLRHTQMAPPVSSTCFSSPEVEMQPLQWRRNNWTRDESSTLTRFTVQWIFV